MTAVFIPVTGDRARELLLGSTPGPWRTGDWGQIEPALIEDEDECLMWSRNADRDLAIAAPDLAATVAWLYGRTPDNDRGTHWTTRGSIIAPFPGSEPVVFTTIRHGEYTPEQAVDLARALLTAAEEARRD